MQHGVEADLLTANRAEEQNKKVSRLTDRDVKPAASVQCQAGTAEQETIDEKLNHATDSASKLVRTFRSSHCLLALHESCDPILVQEQDRVEQQS